MPSPFRVETLAGIRGAYFRKVQSDSRVDNRGIRGVAVLPRVSLDATRQFRSKHGLDHFQTGPLDRASVYIGGHAAGRELDAGLVWDRIYDHQGFATYTDLPDQSDGRGAGHRFVKVQRAGQPAFLDGTGRAVATGIAEVEALLPQLRPNFAFRPFWRTTNNDGKPWNQPRPGTPENRYFYPGEQVSMRVEVIAPNEVILEIGLAGGVPDEQFLVTFRQERFGTGRPQSFKRVNSIDQFMVDASGNRVGLEGRDVLPTRTAITGGRWLEVFILSSGGERPMAGPDFIEVRGGDVAPRYDEIFGLTGWNDLGGEQIDITPAGSE